MIRNQLLQELTELVGLPGHEKEVRVKLKDLIAEHVDEWKVDPMGNLIAYKKGTGAVDLKVMVDAHMDEVGFLITDIDSNGTLKFSTYGGFDSRVLPGKVVQVGPKKIPGVIGNKPVHLSTRAEEERILPKSSLRIDIGAKSKESAQGSVSVGDYATFLTPYEEIEGLDGAEPIALGKAFDDRVGCAIIVELLRSDPFPFDLYASFTVQEEVGLRGAYIAGFSVQPDVALVLDCTPAYDLPISDDESPNVSLGKGPAIYVMDRSTIQDPRLVSHLMQTADQHDIPFQIRQPGGGGTNTAAIQRSGHGVASATVSLPGRYMHAPTSMISLKDYEHTKALVEQALRGLTAEVVARNE